MDEEGRDLEELRGETCCGCGGAGETCCEVGGREREEREEDDVAREGDDDKWSVAPSLDESDQHMPTSRASSTLAQLKGVGSWSR